MLLLAVKGKPTDYPSAGSQVERLRRTLLPISSKGTCNDLCPTNLTSQRFANAPVDPLKEETLRALPHFVNGAATEKA